MLKGSSGLQRFPDRPSPGPRGVEGLVIYMGTGGSEGEPGQRVRTTANKGGTGDEVGRSRPSRLLPLILIDLIPKAHSIHDGQLEVHVALLEVVGLGPQAHTFLVVAGFLGLEGCVEERVHQRGLTDAGLPWEWAVARKGGQRTEMGLSLALG